MLIEGNSVNWVKTIYVVPSWRNQPKTIGKGASSLISLRLIEQLQA